MQFVLLENWTLSLPRAALRHMRREPWKCARCRDPKGCWIYWCEDCSMQFLKGVAAAVGAYVVKQLLG